MNVTLHFGNILYKGHVLDMNIELIRFLIFIH